MSLFDLSQSALRKRAFGARRNTFNNNRSSRDRHVLYVDLSSSGRRARTEIVRLYPRFRSVVRVRVRVYADACRHSKDADATRRDVFANDRDGGLTPSEPRSLRVRRVISSCFIADATLKKRKGKSETRRPLIDRRY